ncbi:MAG: MATE family efflux transporter [Eubacterium sp.]
MSVFNGVAQGSQPLISKYYAKCENENVSKILKLGIITCLCLAGIIIVTVNIFAAPIANVFNSEHIAALTDYAVKGLRNLLYEALPVAAGA